MNTTEFDLPEHVALLPGAVAAQHLTHGVLTGRETPPRVALVRASEPVPSPSDRWRCEGLRELFEVAGERFADTRTAADAWLAPRLHATLRMSRAEAADPRIWNFLALVVAPHYVVWRHLPRTAGKGVATSRFTGWHHTQAFARLWWAAELFRDGEDYGPVETACSNQDMLNTALRLDVIDHRPTALALVEVLGGLTRSGANVLGDRVNALCTAVNVAGATLVYDVIAPDRSPDHDTVRAWIAEGDDAAPVPHNSLPDGPEDGGADPRAVERLTELFTRFQQEAPLRNRSGRTTDEEEG